MMTQKIWQNGVLKPYNEATTHVMSHALHYGSGVFEGIRSYQDLNNNANILCLDQHLTRLFYSAQALKIKIPYTKAELAQAIIDTIKANQLKSCYIRPLIYYGHTTIRLLPKVDTPIEVVIACYEMNNYLPLEELHVKISDFIRIHPQSSDVEAKICGHYVNSLQSLLAIQGTKYSEVILLDYQNNVAEGSSSNLFMLKNDIVYTPAVGTILNGITRQLLIKLIRELGYELIECTIKVADLYDSDEIIMCGTAVEISPITSINDQAIGREKLKKLAPILKEEYRKIYQGENFAYKNYLTQVYID